MAARELAQQRDGSRRASSMLGGIAVSQRARLLPRAPAAMRFQFGGAVPRKLDLF